jgi:hypothetical protein
MKKLLLFLTVIILSSCATVNDYPFAPEYKTGKHKTKKCKPIKKEFKLFDCSKNW